MATKSPVFVVGCDRSGTTILRLMLTRSPHIHILHETGFLRSFLEQENHYGNFAEARQRWYFLRDLQNHRATSETNSFSSFGLSDHEAETALKEVAPTDFTGACRALFMASAQKKGAFRWGDKTPRYVLIIPWLAQAFPDAKFLHIFRDGRDVAASFRRAGWKGGNVRRAAQTWDKRTRAGREAGANLSSDRYREVRYETLVRSTEPTLRSLCDWLDLEFTPKMMSFHEASDSLLPDAHENLYRRTHRPIDASRAQAWRRSLPERDIADVEDVAGDLLRELGYEITGARVPAWLQALRALHRNTASYAKALLDALRRLGIA